MYFIISVGIGKAAMFYYRLYKIELLTSSTFEALQLFSKFCIYYKQDAFQLIISALAWNSYEDLPPSRLLICLFSKERRTFNSWADSTTGRCITAVQCGAGGWGEGPMRDDGTRSIMVQPPGAVSVLQRLMRRNLGLSLWRTFLAKASGKQRQLSKYLR